MAQMTPYLWVVERLVKNMGMKTYWIDRKALEQGFLRQGIERAKDREEINRLKLDNGILVDWCKEKDSEITRLKIEQTGDFATACLKTKIQKQCDQLDVAKKALEYYADKITYGKVASKALSRIAELEGE